MTVAASIRKKRRKYADFVLMVEEHLVEMAQRRLRVHDDGEQLAM